MELYQLRYFQAVASKGSYSAAARHAHVSQPSLSIQINRLEEELGRRVFKRTPKGVRLTPAGENVLETANLIFEQLRKLRHDLHESEPHQIIRMGVQPLLAATILPSILKDFLREHSRTHLAVLERPNYLLPELMVRNEVHFCLMTQLEHFSPQENVSPLLHCKYGVFSRDPQLLKKHRRWGFAQVVPEALLIFRDPNSLEERLRRMGMQMRRPANIVFSSDQALTVLEMCASGAGVAILPLLVKETASRLKLHCRQLDEKKLQTQIALVSRENKVMATATQQFISLLTGRLKKMAF
ncbi:MAG: LysR family transcriptional regulator [Verrucomicrobiae bacterium]|nr:LysR family transcriptional regulator [Verrucomicrobiae bacterium]